MASIKTLEAMDYYKKAYSDYHGRVPYMVENHGWIKIDHSPLAVSYRPSQIIQMADNLIKRVEEGERGIGYIEEIQIKKFKDIFFLNQENKNDDIWTINDNEIIEHKNKKINNSTWKKYIKKDLFELFMNRLFEQCNRSAYDMERIMKDYAIGGSSFFKNEEEIKELNRTIYGLRREIDIYKDLLSDNKDQNTILKNANSLHKKIIDGLKKDMNKLKKNSVLFTMDDIEFNMPEVNKGDI